ARRKSDYTLCADSGGEPPSDRLRVLEALRLQLWILLVRPDRRDNRLRDRFVFLDLRMVPAKRDQEDEAEENDGERDAENANRALHTCRNFLGISRIPRIDENQPRSGLDLEEHIRAAACREDV